MKHLSHVVFGAALAIASALAAANPVQLLLAQSYVEHTASAPIQQVQIDADVANLASNEQVYVHIKSATGSWADVPMTYARPAGSGYGVWQAIGYTLFSPVLGTTPINLTFDIKLVANGQTYWDNNNGNNYQVAADSGNYMPSLNVFDASYAPRVCEEGGMAGTPVNGNITVRNIAYAKTVNIVYTTDNWATTKTVPASYSYTFWSNGLGSYASNPNQYGFEQWSYSFNIGTATQMQYAVSYTVNGQTYWDNNFNQNYTTLIQYGR